MTLHVRAAALDDVPAAAEALADAFADYPWTRWTVDADGHRRADRAAGSGARPRLGRNASAQASYRTGCRSPHRDWASRNRRSSMRKVGWLLRRHDARLRRWNGQAT